MTSGKLNFCEYKCGLSVCGFDLCRCYVDSIIILIYSGTVDHGGLLDQIVKLFHVIFNVSNCTRLVMELMTCLVLMSSFTCSNKTPLNPSTDHTLGICNFDFITN